jgi:hypothetical protein
MTEQGGVAKSTAFGRLTLERGEGGSGGRVYVRPDAAAGITRWS